MSPPGTWWPSWRSRALRWRWVSAIHWAATVTASSWSSKSPVVGELAVAVGDAGSQDRLPLLSLVVRLGGAGEHGAGVVDVVVVEQRSQPAVERGDEGSLLDIDVPRVFAVTVGIVLAKPAPVVSPAVIPVALHPSAADAAPQEPGEKVAPALGRLTSRGTLVAVEHQLGRVEQPLADERLVSWLRRPDPLAGSVPTHLGVMVLGHVLDVDEHLVLALLVPHLEARVAGVPEDGTDGGLGPLALSTPRCRLRPGSCADGDGIPSRLSPEAIRWRPKPPAYSSKIRCTTGDASESGASRRSCRPVAALPGFGWGLTSTRW